MNTAPISALLAVTAACASGPPSTPDPGAGDLPLGDVLAQDLRLDDTWGDALHCKALPALPRLVEPRITLSIDGLTLHLVDPVSGFDKVFAVGPGQIERDPTTAEYGESLSYFPVASTGRSDFAITPATIQPCKTWWTDPVTGAQAPVFAGLPFLGFYGNYAIHGPIDGFRAPSGGTLRRGYVSHGCFRMQGADILEVYARIRGVARVPVHLQREPERLATGATVDLAARWIGAACEVDSDCNYPGGRCAANPYTARGFCSARCASTCADLPGAPTTFCVADPGDPGAGMCVPQAQAQDFACRPYDHLKVDPAARRFLQPVVSAAACVPGSRGWVGDHCLTGTDCASGTSCRGAAPGRPGVCSSACDRVCADQPGYPDTFCATVPALGPGGSCVRQCTPSSNAAECPTGMVCATRPRNGEPAVTRTVCVPAM